MAAPLTVVTNLPKTLLELALALGTTKVMLATATYTPDQDTLDYINDVTNEAAGTSYVAGGLDLDNPVVILNASTNLPTLDADDIVVAGLSVSCRWAVIYIDTGVAATSPVLGYLDLSEGIGGNVTLVDGITWDTDGIIPFQVAA